MPGPSYGMKMPDGISLQDMMKAATLPTTNGSTEGPAAEESKNVNCKECGASSKAARACGGCWQVKVF